MHLWAIPSPELNLGGSTNVPAVLLLATSGVIGLFFIARWMVKFQREFTNFYITENTKLRERIDAMEAEIVRKDELLSANIRDQLKYETKTTRQISELEQTIARHEAHITILEARLSSG